MGNAPSSLIDRLNADFAARFELTSRAIAGSYLAERVREGHCDADVFGSPLALTSAVESYGKAA